LILRILQRIVLLKGETSLNYILRVSLAEIPEQLPEVILH